HLIALLQQRPSEAIKEFRDYMAERENDPLSIGAGYPLIKALLNLNNYCNDCEGQSSGIDTPLVEVVIVSKSSPDTGIQVLNAIREHGLTISRSAFISGSPIAPYIKDFKVDLCVTINRADAQHVAVTNLVAYAILDATPLTTYELDTKQLRIVFDGDAVLFDDSGELLYKQKGLRAFHERDAEMRDLPIE